MMKKSLKICLVIVLVFVGIILLDTIQALVFNNNPIIKIRKNYNGGYLYYIDWGILVDTYYCSNDIKDTVIKGFSYSCSFGDYTIVDTTKNKTDFVCAEALEQFFTDTNYDYYFNCIKSKYIEVRYSDNTIENVKDALSNGHINIGDLDKFNIEYIKYEKDIPQKDFDISIVEEDNCNLKLKEYYKYEDRIVYTSCINEIYLIRDDAKDITLAYHLKNVNQTFDRSIKQLVSDAVKASVLKDGGTTIYKKDNYTIIDCNTIEGNKDVYIGNKDFKFEQGYCK